MGALLRVTCSMSSHRELSKITLHLMGNLGSQGYPTINVTSQTDSNQFVRV